MSTVEMHNLPGVVRITGALPGPRVVIMGGVHGNEPCGVTAVQRLEREFASGALKLTCGELMLITANHLALEQDVRFVERNLNRLFKDTSDQPDCYEVRRAEELKPLLAQAHYLLDLHAATSPTPPFLMCEEDGIDLARQLGIARVVLGWAALGNQALTGDSETWARAHGARSFTLECGQLREPAGDEVAWQASMRFLTLTGLIERPLEPEASEPLLLWLYSSQIMQDPQFEYSRTYSGFDFIPSGELIGKDKFGEYHANRDSWMIFPVPVALTVLGTELYLLAERYVARD